LKMPEYFTTNRYSAALFGAFYGPAPGFL